MGLISNPSLSHSFIYLRCIFHPSCRDTTCIAEIPGDSLDAKTMLNFSHHLRAIVNSVSSPWPCCLLLLILGILLFSNPTEGIHLSVDEEASSPPFCCSTGPPGLMTPIAHMGKGRNSFLTPWGKKGKAPVKKVHLYEAHLPRCSHSWTGMLPYQRPHRTPSLSCFHCILPWVNN